MPYIKQEDRSVYDVSIKNICEIIVQEERDINRAEMAAWVCRKVICRFLKIPYVAHFSELKLDSQMMHSLRKYSDVVCAVFESKFRENDPQAILNISGEFNYFISSILWGVSGDAPGYSDARYGFRCYLSSLIEEVLYEIPNIQGDVNQKRKYVMIKGVLRDVLMELYRQKTSVYEDIKIEENGNLW